LPRIKKGVGRHALTDHPHFVCAPCSIFPVSVTPGRRNQDLFQRLRSRQTRSSHSRVERQEARTETAIQLGNHAPVYLSFLFSLRPVYRLPRARGAIAGHSTAPTRTYLFIFNFRQRETPESANFSGVYLGAGGRTRQKNREIVPFKTEA